MRCKITGGTTNFMLPIFVQDSSKTDGSGLGSLTSGTSGLVGEYRRYGATSWTSITLTSATLGNFTSGGWVANGSVAGSYEVGIPNAALGANVPWVEIQFRGAANMVPVKIFIELDAFGYQDGTRGGLAALPNASAGSAGGLLSFGTGTGQLNPSSGNVVASSVTGNVGGNVVGSVGSVTGAVGSVTGNVGGSTASVTGNVGGDVAGKVLGGGSGTITGDGVRASSVTGAVGSVTGAVGSVTGLTTSTIAAAVWDLSTTGHTTSGTFGAAMVAAGSAGDPWATSLPGSYGSGTAGNILGNRLDAAVSTRSTFAGGAVASVTGSVGSVTGSVGSVVGNVGGNVSGNVVGSTASVSGSVGSVTGSVGSVTGSVGSVTGSVGGSVASVAGSVGSVSGGVGGDVAGKVLGGGAGTITGDGVRASSVTGAVGSVTGAVGSVTGLTNSTIAAAVWDLTTTGHTTGGTFGAAMNAAGSAGDPWATNLPGSYASGTAGNILGNRLDAAISTRSTYAGGAVASVTGAVGSVTGNVGGNVVGSVGSVTGAVGSVTGAVGSVTGSVTVGTNNDKTGYKLASDGLDTISITAPAGVASNFREMVVQVWRRFFKKVTMTATQTKTYADNGTTVLTTQTNSDDGTTQTIGNAS